MFTNFSCSSIFVTAQQGIIRIVPNGGGLLPTPFLDIRNNVDSSGERGILGIALDPNFQNNNWVYVYYTSKTPTIHNRVSRFTANGNVVQAGSEIFLLDIETLSSATNHNGGAIHFGPSGNLLIAVGDNNDGANKAEPEQSQRQDSTDQKRWLHSSGKPVLQYSLRQ